MLKISKTSLLSIALLGIFLGGCMVAKPADTSTETPTVTLQGTLIVGDSVKLQTPEKIVDLDTRKVDVKGMDKKTVKVTGEYSGTTLFVDKLEQ